MSNRPAVDRNHIQRMSYLPVSAVLILSFACLSCATAVAQTTSTLVPSSYVTTSGTSGGQAAASSIDLLDESGSTNTWAKYVEFQTTSSNTYAGYQIFTLPTSVAPASVTAIQLKLNYQGPLASEQVWTWQLYNWTTGLWATVGSNSVDTSGWAAWQILTFNVTGTLANYVRASDGQMRVQLLSNNHADNVDIDYEALLVTYANGVSVSVSPANPSVQTSATQQFTATVTGSSNTAVNWQVNGVAGGNSVTGTISTSGLYTAPSAVPSPAAVTVNAISQADTTKSASTTVTVTAPAAVSVTVSPATATLQTSATQQFTATVTGSSNTSVTWQVNGIVSGNSTVGTVSAAGLYAAPSAVPTPATVSVTAVSQADTTKSASAQVTITSGGGGISYYVSPTGNNGNLGTAASPWKTITYAVSKASAGVTIHALPGIYSETVNINKSGSASAGYITLISDTDKAAILDGTGLSPSGQVGMITIASQSYIIVKGFEIRNYTTTNDNYEPLGVFISGAGSYIQILNNHIHNISNTGKPSQTNGNCGGNEPQAHGLLAIGTQAPASLNNITIDSNELDHLTTGCSESMTVDGNIQYWAVTNNLVHDNNNIGIDAAGFEQSISATYDQPRDGTMSGNTVYNITSYANPVYGKQYSADGLYCDGCTRVTMERNIVHNTDYAVEVTSEHQGKLGSSVIVRSNLIYNNNSSGLSIGGSGSTNGGTDACTFVNNTFYNNDTKNTGSGEFQIQFNVTSNNIFENNIVYAGSGNLLIYYTNSTSAAITSNYNLFNSPGGSAAGTWVWRGTTITGFSSYTSSAHDAQSAFADPQFVNVTTPNFSVAATSPAVNTGNTSLGSSLFGTLDLAGNARVQGANIDRGAYEQ